MSARHLPFPLTFLVAVSATIFLVIFFGAWAVSVDAGDRGNALTFGFANSGTSVDGRVINSSQLAGSTASAQGKIDGEGSADSWWGKAFLKACPLH